MSKESFFKLWRRFWQGRPQGFEAGLTLWFVLDIVAIAATVLLLWLCVHGYRTGRM